MKTLIAFILMLSSPLFASLGGLETKAEVELKLNLTKAGYENLRLHLLKEFKAEESSRSDYYFDVFENYEYILKKASPPIKLRFMWDGLDLKWQSQKTMKTYAHSWFTFKETLADSSLIQRSPELLLLIDEYHQKLEKPLQDTHDILILAKKIEESLIERNIIAASSQNYFSTHINHKKRVKIKLKLEADQFNVQLGETDNRGVVTYELEAEIKKITDTKKSAERLKTWLISNGFNSSHIETKAETDPALYSQNILRQIY
jgi:hypothetical protein